MSSPKYYETRWFSVIKSVFPGLHGWHCIRQVYEANNPSRDDPVQQQRSRHTQERQLLSPLQDRRYEVSQETCILIGYFSCFNSDFVSRPTHLLESHVSGHLLTKKSTEEGEVRGGK